jgi:outer membrane protein OmpA-like peptidoglycan-associated protein
MLRRTRATAVLITGHTDASGDAGYNFKLSGLRAESALDVLTGDGSAWTQAANGKHQVADYPGHRPFHDPSADAP